MLCTIQKIIKIRYCHKFATIFENYGGKTLL